MYVTSRFCFIDELSYEDFVRAHSLAPLVDIKTACRVANVGLSWWRMVRSSLFQTVDVEMSLPKICTGIIWRWLLPLTWRSREMARIAGQPSNILNKHFSPYDVRFASFSSIGPAVYKRGRMGASLSLPTKQKNAPLVLLKINVDFW
jgi:hypothetical protein